MMVEYPGEKRNEESQDKISADITQQSHTVYRQASVRPITFPTLCNDLPAEFTLSLTLAAEHYVSLDTTKRQNTSADNELSQRGP